MRIARKGANTKTFSVIKTIILEAKFTLAFSHQFTCCHVFVSWEETGKLRGKPHCKATQELRTDVNLSSRLSSETATLPTKTPSLVSKSLTTYSDSPRNKRVKTVQEKRGIKY